MPRSLQLPLGPQLPGCSADSQRLQTESQTGPASINKYKWMTNPRGAHSPCSQKVFCKKSLDEELRTQVPDRHLPDIQKRRLASSLHWTLVIYSLVINIFYKQKQKVGLLLLGNSLLADWKRALLCYIGQAGIKLILLFRSPKQWD